MWSVCPSERTHASRSYILLFTTVIYSIVNRKLSIYNLNTSVRLILFNLPQRILGSEKEGLGIGIGLGLNQKELIRAMEFLLMAAGLNSLRDDGFYADGIATSGRSGFAAVYAISSVFRLMVNGGDMEKKKSIIEKGFMFYPRIQC